MSRRDRNNEERHPDIKREIMVRVKLLYALFLVATFVIFGRILWLQYGPAGVALREKVHERTFWLERTDGHRGEIYAADGSLLATSVTMYYLGMDFAVDSLTPARFYAGVDGLADSLAALFGDRTAAEYGEFLRRGYADRDRRGYRRLNSRLVSMDEMKRVATFPLFRLPPGWGGLAPERVFHREHPYGGLAERTLGTTRTQYDTLVVPSRDSMERDRQLMLTERGLYGLEYSFDDRLRGRNGWQMMQKVTPRFSTPVSSPLNVEPTDGLNVTTTLDMDFQDVAHSMLASQLVRHGALYGTVILMEVATGRIEAIANLERFGDECREVMNYGMATRSEPGSTFKLASLLALLDDGMGLSDLVEVGNGKLTLRGAEFEDDHDPERRYETLQRVFEMSSNVGFVQAVEERFVSRGREQEYVDYIAGLGFDRPLGTEIVGEAVPVVHKPTPEMRREGRWNRNSLSFMSHGYGFEVSPLHVLTLYNAVANDGRMVRPMLVSALTGADTTVVERFTTQVINPRIAPRRTIAAVRRSLEGVVEEGTARVLQNPYYKVAAKTGTAQQLTGGRYQGGRRGQLYMATMVGYFPADAPKYSCIVSIWTRYNAAGDVFYGSNLAGPVFKAVADRVFVTNYEWQTPVGR